LAARQWHSVEVHGNRFSGFLYSHSILLPWDSNDTDLQKPNSICPLIFRTERYITKSYCSLTRRCCQHSHCGRHIACTPRCIDHWYNETGCQDKLHTSSLSSSLSCQIKQSTVKTSDLI